jgi:AcrR family transcriptional regulator
MTMPVVAPPSADTAVRILDGAFDCICEIGLGRTTMEDVARAAGVSRQTVYRYFPSKDHLILALVLREEEKFLNGVRTAFSANTELEQACYDGFLFCLRFAREHPLLDRLLATDPETLLPYLTTRSGPVMARARDVLVELIGSKAWVRANLLEQATDTSVRMVLSYALAPPDRPEHVVARDLARTLTVALTGNEARKETGRR